MTTQRGGLGALAAIACYTVDSDDSDTEDMDVEEDPVSLASHIVEAILNKVTGGDIKVEIKEEPLDIKEEPEDYENIVVTPYVGWMTDSIGYRDPTTIKVEDDSEDSESDSDSSSTSDSSEDDKASPKVVEEEPKPSNQPIKSKNEIGLSDLPPIKDLHITVPEEECVKMGTVASCVQELVVIESVAGHPALDLDTVLFLDFGKRTLGQVFDVIGPVNQPLYCVRFNSVKHIQEKEVVPGMAVFYAPKTEHTAYVFLEQLMKMKISDASWANDEEPPPNFLDYSDDEEERKAKQEHKLERMKKAGATEDEVAAKRAKFTKGRNRNEAAGDRLPGAVEANSVNNKNNRNANNRGLSGSSNTNSDNGARRGNGLYGENNNPFYRRSRTYDPKENGPIRWGSAMPGGVPTVPNLSTPPPPKHANPSPYSNTAPPHHPPFGAAASPRQQQIYGQPSMYHQQQQNHGRQLQNQWRKQPPKQNQWQQQPSQQNQWQQQPSQQNQWQQQPPQQNQWQQQPPQQNQWQQQPPQQNQWQQQPPQQQDQWQARQQQNLWQQPQQQQSQAPNHPQWQQSQPEAPRQRNWQQTKNPQNEMKGYRTASPPPPPPGT